MVLNVCTKPTVFRAVEKVLQRPSSHWVGDGFKVYPVLDNVAFTEAISPLLMFDYGEPTAFPPHSGKPRGVGKHPHRGFETVTIAFSGEVEHKDSTGNTGIIKEGDVQWMTTGRGIIHEEYHSQEFTKNGGVFEMCQLWVNLPKKYKMTKPNYQPISKADIPTVKLPFSLSDERERSSNDTVIATARIIAGKLFGTKGPAKTFSPVDMWDVTIPVAKSVVDLPFPADHNCIIFVRRGSLEVISGTDHSSVTTTTTTPSSSSSSSLTTKFQVTKLNPQDVALLKLKNNDSSMIRIQSLQKDTSFMILGGKPLNEPIAARGPFVMNTQQELNEAMIDYRLGKMGR